MVDLIAVLKSGDLGLTTNYRAIGLSPIAAKTTNNRFKESYLSYIHISDRKEQQRHIFSFLGE